MTGLFHPSTMVALRRRLYLIIAAAGLLGLLALVFTESEATLSANPPQAGAVKPLTEGAAMDGFGVWAPDGKRIAFMRDGQIWLMGATGKNARALTSNAAVWDAVPAWRPDGKAIGFARMTMHGDGAVIMTVEPDGGKERELAKVSEPVGHIAWAPSGKTIYFSTLRKLMQLDVATGKIQQLLEAKSDWELQAGGIAVSPDGTRVIYGAGPRMGRQVLYDLWVLKVGDTEPQRVTTGGGIMPVLDRKGKLLAYRNPRTRTGIYLMDVATHATRQVVPDERGAMYFHPAFAPDGKTLLLSRLLVDSGNREEGKRFTSHLYLHTLTPSGRD
ncbi:MAG TPA: hypothetical protein VD902_15375 [Symbiobacteriaceae bacterium]|nr:hypothetical protein [Symbiobacteriaceae bacterium]